MDEMFYALNGYNTLSNSVSNQVIAGTEVDDSISNDGHSVNILSYNGNDTIINTGDRVTVSHGEGNSHITNSGILTAISSGAGNDNITNSANLVTILGGDGNNKITNSGKDAIIIGGNGLDNVTNSSGAENVYISLGSDSNYVHNVERNVTIVGGSDRDRVTNSGENVFMQLGDGDNHVENSGNKNIIQLDNGNNYVYNFGNKNTITSGSGNDTVLNKHGNVVISLNGGDDTFFYGHYNYTTSTETANNITVFGGTGNDKISVQHKDIHGPESTMKNFFDGGAGNDTLESYSCNSTVIGGTGDDQIYLTENTLTSANGNLVKYTYGDGNDTIFGFNAQDTLQIVTAGKSYSTLLTENDLYFMFDNGSVALKNISLGSGVGDKNFVIIQNEPATQQPATQATVPATNTTDTTPASGNTTVTNTTTNTTINNTTINNYFGFPLASNMFGFFGGQNNTIQNFKTGRGFNANVLAFGTSLTSINRTSSAMYFNAADGTKLQVNNSSSVNEAIQYTTDGTNISYAKVGYAEKNNSFTYEDGVNFYSGGSHTDVLQVTNYQSCNIWLDGSAGVGYSGINNIDASTSTGNNTLAGDGGNNQITAGSGNDSLWGGSGSSEDVLIGGSGQNMFWYGKGDGNDQVQQSKTGDVINLYDVTLSDIVSANFTGNAISATFNTGFSLNVNVSSNLSSTFRLADGSNWQYNKSAGSWQSA